MEHDIWSGLDHKSGQERMIWGMFSFHGKMRRQGWWGYGVLGSTILGFFVGFTFGFIAGATGSDGFFVFEAILSYGIGAWITLASTVKRLRSMEWAPGLAALMLIPLVNLVMLILINVNKGKNHREPTATIFE